MSFHFGDVYSHSNSPTTAFALQPHNEFWGNANIKTVSASGSVVTRGTNVCGPIISGADVDGKRTYAHKISARGLVKLEESNIDGSVTTERSVDITSSRVRSIDAKENILLNKSICFGSLRAEGDVDASDCRLLGRIEADGIVSATDIKSIASIRADHVLLQRSVVWGNVTSKVTPSITNSTITGSLIFSSTCCMITIENSDINTLHISAPADHSAMRSAHLRNFSTQSIDEQISIGSNSEFDDVFFDGQVANQDLLPSVLTLKGSSKINRIFFVRLNGTVIVEDSASVSPTNVIGERIVKA